jgi:hypothetical protein
MGILSYLEGAVVLGVILAVTFGDFLGSHPVLAVIIAVAYVALCASGAYSKYKSEAAHYRRKSL